MIRSFVLDTEEGHALFSTNLYSSDPFLFEGSGQPCFYGFDSTRRSVNVTLAKNPKDIPPYTGIYDALAKVTDNFYGKVMRISGTDTTRAYNMQNTIVRYGYFIKPFADWYPNRGWEFWGFIGGKYSPGLIPGNRSIIGSDGLTMPALPPQGPPPSPSSGSSAGYYINFDDIKKFPPGDSLTLKSSEKDLVFIETDMGMIKPLNVISAGNGFQTGWKVPPETNKLYHLMTFDRSGYFVVDTIGQAIESTLIKRDDYVIPYGLKL